MDKVRLGRALGYGARHAAKTVAAVAEAATAPDPGATSARTSNTRTTGESAQIPTNRTRSSRPAKIPDPARVRGAGRSMWAPLAAFSGALWLRVTGVFFAMIAWAMAAGAWRFRGAVRAGGTVESRHFWMFACFGVLFGYFALSGFVRASARERQTERQTARRAAPR